MWQEFINLFSGTGVIAMVIMIFGMMLCMVEIAMPGFGVFGVMGTIFTFAGMVVRFMMGTKTTQVIAMFLFVIVVAVVTVVLVIVLARLGVLGKTHIIQEKTSVPVDYEKSSKEQRKLIGKVGFAKTVFKTSGKLVIDDKVYDAMSEGEYIEKDSKIKVIAIRNNTIIVKKV